MSTNARARAAPSERPVERFDYGTPDGYRFFLELGAAASADRSISPTTCRPATTTWRTAPTTSAGRRATSRRISTSVDASGADRRLVVRRAGFSWAVPDVPGDEGEEPGEQDDAGRRTVDARRLGRAAMATRSATSGFGSKTAAHFRSEIELPFFNFYLKDKGPAKAGHYVVARTAS